jgi:formylglycine-generating enzyme required for sulfatase activity
MAIARDIEQVPENWTGGAVGSGILKRGNVGTPDAGSYDGDNPETGILNSKAILKLSNGEEIYHFSGNVWEWVDDKIECGVASCPISMMPYDSTPASEWVEFTSVNTWGKYSRAELGPLGAYTGTNGVGKINTDYDAAAGSSDTYTHAFRRGGHWNDGANAGVFALILNDSPTSLHTAFGFRCAR